MGDAKRRKVFGGVEHEQIGRLALREEGDRWVAYYALPSSMKDPLFIAAIAIGSVAGRPERMRQFRALCQEVIGDIFEEATGLRPAWGQSETAPEHERGKGGADPSRAN